jgi:hypothetical protein
MTRVPSQIENLARRKIGEIHPHLDPLPSRERVLYEIMNKIMIKYMSNHICLPNLSQSRSRINSFSNSLREWISIP